MKFLIGANDPQSGYDSSGINPDAVTESEAGNNASSTGDTTSFDPNKPLNQGDSNARKTTNWIMYGLIGLVMYAFLFNKEK